MPRRGRWAALAAAALVVAWWYLGTPLDPAPKPGDQAASLGNLPSGNPGGTAAPGEPAPPHATPAPATLPTAFTLPEDCRAAGGHADVKAPTAEVAQADQLQDDMTRQLLATADARAQAAGWLLEASRHLGPAPQASGLEAASRLAAMAQAGRDPVVYAWALQACASAKAIPPGPPACDALSHQRWSELAPNQAWPWLAMATQAERAGDLSGFENAMHRASQATDWRNPGRDFQQQLLTHLPTAASDTEKAVALMPGMNLLTGLSAHLAGVARYCPEQQDPNRQQNCQRIAAQVLDHADNLLELRLGLAAAQRSGVDEALLTRAQADSASADRAMAFPEPQIGHPEVLCNAMVRSLRRAVRLAEVGELQALREEAAKLPQ